MFSFTHLVNKYLWTPCKFDTGRGTIDTVVNKKEMVPFPQETHRLIGKTGKLVENYNA